MSEHSAHPYLRPVVVPQLVGAKRDFEGINDRGHDVPSGFVSVLSYLSQYIDWGKVYSPGGR